VETIFGHKCTRYFFTKRRNLDSVPQRKVQNCTQRELGNVLGTKASSGWMLLDPN
jgi:hypothetical protein